MARLAYQQQEQTTTDKPFEILHLGQFQGVVSLTKKRKLVKKRHKKEKMGLFQ